MKLYTATWTQRALAPVECPRHPLWYSISGAFWYFYLALLTGHVFTRIQDQMSKNRPCCPNSNVPWQGYFGLFSEHYQRASKAKRPRSVHAANVPRTWSPGPSYFAKLNFVYDVPWVIQVSCTFFGTKLEY